MKKIVALVLALVLALSLATVAFAADEAYFSTKVGGMKMTGVTLKETKAAGEKNVAVYTPVVTVNGKEVPMMLSLVEATEADYDYVFVDGEKVTYLMNSVNGAYTGEAKAVTGVAAADATCGDMVVADDVALYVMDGEYYKAMGSWNLRSALNKAIKDKATEDFYDVVGFTKDNLMAALKDVLLNDAAASLTDVNLGNPGEMLATIGGLTWKVLDQAKHGEAYSYNATRGEVPGAAKLFVTYGDFVAALTGAFEDGLLKTARDEAIGNMVEYVAAKLGFEAPAAAPTYPTDADFNGENLMLNIAREIGKQGTTVKAIALVDGKLLTLAAATASTSLTKTYDTKTGAMTATQDGDYYVVPHAYAAEYATVNGKTELTKVYCETCGAEFNFVVGCEKDAVAAFGEGNYANITNEFKYGFTTNFLGKHSVTIGAAAMDWDTMTYTAAVDWKAGTGYVWDLFDEDSRNVMKALDGKQLYISTKAVESAETFDAGIALYAGMALMSVTGSAIVIGKKKEF